MPDTSPSALTDATARWRADLVAAAGRDALVDFHDLDTGTLDLATAHPSGLAQFLAGRPTRLSSLFREPAALTAARQRARTIRLAAIHLADQHGVGGAYLASGLVHWRARDSRPIQAPVLLRTLTLRPRGPGQVDDDLALGHQTRVNPALVRLLAEHDVTIDVQALTDLATGRHGYDPVPALQALRAEAGHLPGFTATERTVVGLFVDVVPALLADFDEQATALADHPVVTALAREATTPADDAAPVAAEAPAGPDGPTDPAADTTPTSLSHPVVDLDPHQHRVALAVEQGRSVHVSAPPGTGATRLVSQLVAGQAGRGRSTLLVCAQRAEVLGVVDTLTSLGLGELVRDPGGLLDGTRPRAAAPTDLTDPPPDATPEAADAALVALAEERAALHRTVSPWGVSVSQALHALARLSSGPRAPRTTVRLDRDTTARLAGHQRAATADLLRRAADLGAFAAAAERSPWHGADLDDEDDATAVLAAARRLATETLPALRAHMARIAGVTGLAAAASVDDWGHQLALLVDVRTTLDTFTPTVYERSVTDLIAATGSGAWRNEQGVRMSALERRRWRRLAKDLLRPGSQPDDLHRALIRAQAERTRWQQMAVGGGWPRVPSGLAEAETVHERARQDLAVLDAALTGTPDGGLLHAPLDVLVTRVERLAAADDDAQSLPARVAVLGTLRHTGLGDLLADLLARRVPATQVAGELDLCWWASVLDHALTDLPEGPADGLDASGYRRLQHRARAAVAARIRDVERAKAVPSCTVVSPLSLPQVLPGRHRYDLVVIAGAHACAVAEGVLAMARGAQLVVIGDPHGLPPAGLDLLRDDRSTPTGPPPARRASVLEATAPVLERFRLGHQHRIPEQLVAVLPEPPSWTVPAPDGGIDLSYVPDGTGRLETDGDGAVESVDAEVRRVVDLVLEHARTRPDRSLAVLTTTRHHARRVADAVRADLPEHPDAAAFFTRPGREPFVVTDLPRCEDAVRDDVILSIGFGLTPRGRVLHRFGPLDADGGDRALAVATSRARRTLTVVSCVAADDLDPEKLNTPGAKALRALLATAGKGPETAHEVDGRTLDALVDDLAKRLHDKGFRVEPRDRRQGWPDLAVRSDGGRPVAVLTDSRWVPGVRGPSATVLVADDLAVTEHLARFGWRTVVLSSLELFTDADAAVAAVEAAAGR